MTINPMILQLLKDNNIYVDDGILYLIALYYNYEPNYIPNTLKERLNRLQIYEMSDTGLHWNINLFDNQTTSFDWVKTEYVPLFKEANPEKGKHAREAAIRIKKLMMSSPSIRKADILAATKLYLSRTDHRFIREPHYFIEKGMGTGKTMDILTWLDEVEDLKNTGDITGGRSSITNTMK